MIGAVLSEISRQATPIWVRNRDLSVSMDKETEDEEESNKIEHREEAIEFAYDLGRNRGTYKNKFGERIGRRPTRSQPPNWNRVKSMSEMETEDKLFHLVNIVNYYYD